MYREKREEKVDGCYKFNCAATTNPLHQPENNMLKSKYQMRWYLEFWLWGSQVLLRV